MTNKTNNFMIVCPEVYSLVSKGYKFFYTPGGRKRKYNLEVILDIYAPRRVGYAFYKGKYVGAFSMAAMYGTFTVLQGRPL